MNIGKTIRKIIREELISYLKPKGIGTQKAANGLILNNLPGSPRLDIHADRVDFKLIISSDGFRISHSTLTFKIGDLHDPKTDPTAFAKRIAKAIQAYVKFCEMSDDFVLSSPQLVGSSKMAALRKILKKILPKEFFEMHDVEDAIRRTMKMFYVYEDGEVKHKHLAAKGYEMISATPEDIAQIISSTARDQTKRVNYKTSRAK